MKRYLVFAGESYYPNGGIDDLGYTADTVDECTSWIDEFCVGAEKGDLWVEIVEHATMTRVFRQRYWKGKPLGIYQTP